MKRTTEKQIPELGDMVHVHFPTLNSGVGRVIAEIDIAGRPGFRVVNGERMWNVPMWKVSLKVS